MKLAAVVVLYHPDGNLIRNINSYLPQVDTLVLWDNTPEGEKATPLSLSGVCHPERLQYMGCGRNVGIGAALNQAVAYARDNGFTHSQPSVQKICIFGKAVRRSINFSILICTDSKDITAMLDGSIEKTTYSAFPAIKPYLPKVSRPKSC